MGIVLVGLFIAPFALSFALSEWLRLSGDSRVLRSLDQLPDGAQIVVLGCKPRQPSGRLNQYFAGRAASAAAAYHHRRDDRDDGHAVSDAGVAILCSGRSYHGMNEAAELAHALESAAVPRSAIRLDADSDRTIDSIDHVARFHANQPIVFVTQSFHLPRALFLARHRGLDAWGLLAKGARPSLRGQVREGLAEYRALWDVLRRRIRN